MSLLQPWHLWALTGLIVPLAIHLLSRKEGPTIRMGSLRHIRETSSRQFRSIRLNEYLLLALRSIMIALVVLLMSGWYLEHLRDDHTLLILEQGLENRSDLKPLRDSLRSAGFEERYLLPGFPPVSDERSAAVPDYAARLEELERGDIDSAIIMATNRLSGFVGDRASLPENVRWMAFEGSASEFEVQRMRLQGDSVFIRKGKSSAGETTFSGYSLLNPIDSGMKPVDRKTIRITVVADRAFDVDKRIMIAAIHAIGSQIPEVVEVASVAPGGAYNEEGLDWLIWLSESPPPGRSGNLLYYDEHSGHPILMDENVNRVVLTSRLNSEVAVTRHLAVQLMQRLAPSKEEWANAGMHDKRVVDDQQAWSKAHRTVRGAIDERGNEASTHYLLMALLVILLLERFVSYHRNQ